MNTDQMVDVPVQDAAWGHATALDADGLELHYVRWGKELPVCSCCMAGLASGMIGDVSFLV